MRILFLTAQLPFPAESGGTIKTLSIIEYLRERHDLRVLCFHRSELSGGQERWASDNNALSLVLDKPRNLTNLLRSYIANVPLSIERNKSDQMLRRVAADVRREAPDAVFVDGWLMAQYLPHPYAGLTLFHEHNAEYVLWERQVSAEGNRLRRAVVSYEARRVAAYEAKAVGAFDVVFTVSPADKHALTRLGTNRDTVLVLANLPDRRLLGLPPLSFDASEPLVFYFGTLSWQPNIEGLTFFLRDVWPLVRERVPAAQLAIAGRGAPPALEKLARGSAGAEFLGAIADAEPLYRRARVSIETTHTGGGTKLKVLNAFARGLPVVASPEAVEGIEAEGGKHVLVGGAPDALADAVARLLTDPAAWHGLSGAGRALVRERYLPEVAYAVLDEVLSGAGVER